MPKRNFAVIGHPIGHTMSPFIHKRLFELAHESGAVVAIDGKTTCGSGNNQHRAYHVVGAFITEKQMFPFDKYQTLLYFSVFKRKDK